MGVSEFLLVLAHLGVVVPDREPLNSCVCLCVRKWWLSILDVLWTTAVRKVIAISC